jgi:hypothetical protein
MLITLFLDYAGGTYVSQTEVQDLSEIPSRLAHAISWESLSPRPSPLTVSKFIEAIAEDSIVELSGAREVWCLSGMLGDKLGLIQLVNTVPASANK